MTKIAPSHNPFLSTVFNCLFCSTLTLSSRSNKAEKNADGLQEIEREVDRYKDILQNLNKRIATTVAAGQPQDAAAKEKRIRKVSEFQLGQLMEDSVKDLPAGLLRDVLDRSGTFVSRLFCPTPSPQSFNLFDSIFSPPGKDHRVGNRHQ